jgi:ribonuclease HI
VFQDGKEIVRNSGKRDMTTNNQMELQAVIEALKESQNSKFRIQNNLAICTDSKYVYEGITSYIHDRKRRGWRLASK